jgi:hypothetical protein
VYLLQKYFKQSATFRASKTDVRLVVPPAGSYCYHFLCPNISLIRFFFILGYKMIVVVDRAGASVLCSTSYAARPRLALSARKLGPLNVPSRRPLVNAAENGSVGSSEENGSRGVMDWVRYVCRLACSASKGQT